MSENLKSLSNITGSNFPIARILTNVEPLSQTRIENEKNANIDLTNEKSDEQSGGAILNPTSEVSSSLTEKSNKSSISINNELNNEATTKPSSETVSAQSTNQQQEFSDISSKSLTKLAQDLILKFNQKRVKDQKLLEEFHLGLNMLNESFRKKMESSMRYEKYTQKITEKIGVLKDDLERIQKLEQELVAIREQVEMLHNEIFK